MRAFIATAALLATGAMAVEPAFPGASLEAATKISEAVSAAESSEGYSKLTGGAGGQGANVQALVAAGKARLVEEVSDSNKLTSLKKAAFVAVSTNLLKSIYVGGCPRDYAASKCPIDWEESGSGVCAPSASYSGLCGPQNVGAMSGAELEDFQWKCRASWPCTSGCSLNFDSCPSGWTSSSEGCVAPKDYSGICAPVTNFSKMSSADKQQWASMCGASFGCK